MNGRPLHVRQQQFQKESQYRNMLKDQIEENKRKKVMTALLVSLSVNRGAVIVLELLLLLLP